MYEAFVSGWAADALKPHGQVVCYGSNALQQTFEYRPWLFNSLGNVVVDIAAA